MAAFLPIIISLGMFVCVAGIIILFGYVRYVRPSRLVEQLNTNVLVPQTATAIGVQPKKDAPIVRVIQELGEKIPVSPQEAGDARKRLIMAGFREDSALPIFRGIQIAGAIAGLLAGFTLRIGLPNMSVLFPFIAAGFGYWVPNFILSKLITSRQEKLRLSLPDALDLLVICVEAGIGLDQAIQKVSQELAITHKHICKELSMVVLEARAGKRRIEALHNLADRTGQSDIRKLVQVLAQSDRFGTSMADALRAHSDFMRVKRRQDAQERAGKVPVKLVFPIFAFILPSILAVSTGPAMIRVFKVLIPMMQGIGNG
ncbi:MAG: type II secretion system F family protein [Bryobacterales bacterium]|nr:type II secretion system F family protein [Bryobacterales bacterium]